MPKLKLLVLLILLGSSSVAMADMKIAVLHTRIKSKFGRLALGNAIDQALGELAKRSGYEVIDTSVTLEEDLCREVDCLPGIAERHGLQALVFAEVLFNQTINSDLIRVSLYRVDAKTSLRKEEEQCAACSADKASKLVDAVATRLLRSEPGSGAPLDGMGLLPQQSPAPVAASNNRSAFLALGAVSAVGLVGSLVAIGVEGSRSGGCTRHGGIDRLCLDTRDTTPPLIGAAVSGIVFLALTPTFFVLAHREAKKSVVVTSYVLPTFDQNGAGIIAGGRF